MRRLGATLGCVVAVVSCSDDGTAGSSTDDSVVVANSDAVAQLCWSTINALRARASLPAYERWTGAETCANAEAKSDADANKPHSAFPRCGELDQNECPTLALDPERAVVTCLESIWREGPGNGRYEAMASRQHTKAACGVFVTAKGLTWSVQDFR